MSSNWSLCSTKTNSRAANKKPHSSLGPLTYSVRLVPRRRNREHGIVSQLPHVGSVCLWKQEDAEMVPTDGTSKYVIRNWTFP